MAVDFQVKVLLLAFAITVVLAIVIIPILKRLKVGQNEREDGPQSHIKKQGTPTMGGIIMLISIIVCSIGGYLYYKPDEVEVAKNIIPLAIVTVGFGFIGFLDDFKKLVLKNTKGLSPALKMLGLLVIAVGYAVYLTQVLNLGTDIFVPFVKTSLQMPIYLQHLLS